MFKRLTAVVVTAIFLFVLSLTAGAGEWKAVYSQHKGIDEGDGDLTQIMYLQTSDGRVQQLTDKNDSSGSAAWSPNGEEIAYSVAGKGVWIMNADGSNQRKLVQGSVGVVSEHYVVYESTRGNRWFAYIVRRDNLEASPLELAEGATPDVSFDEKQVVFNAGSIHVINIDGTGERLVADAFDGAFAGAFDEPRFLPDGRIVVELSPRTRILDEVVIINPDTGEIKLLVHGIYPTVTRDGWVVYMGDDGWQAIKPDGTGNHLLDPNKNKSGFRVYEIGELASPPDNGGEEPRAVSPLGKTATTWAELKAR